MTRDIEYEAGKDNWLNLSGKEACEEILFGSVAGMIAEIFEYPFDLAKVRLQAQLLHSVEGNRLPAFKGPLHCLNQTWREEGIRGLYRGLSVPLMGTMVQTAGLFFSYASFQHAIQNHQYGNTHLEGRKKPPLTIPQLGMAAAGAGLATSFLLTPMELVKCKMQVQMMKIHSQGLRYPSNPFPIISPATNIHQNSSAPGMCSTVIKPPGSLAIIRSILRDHGLTGFWLGQTGTIFRETGGCAVWFVVKEVVANALQQRRYNIQGKENMGKASPNISDYTTDILLWESALSGAAAGACATLLFYPADTVKSIIQTEEELRTSSRRVTSMGARPTTFWRAASKMYHAHGFRGFYAGCGMTVARSVPSSGIIFVVYDGLRQWLSQEPLSLFYK